MNRIAIPIESLNRFKFIDFVLFNYFFVFFEKLSFKTYGTVHAVLRALLMLFFLFCGLSHLSSQTIDEPNVSSQNNKSTKIEYVVINKDETIVAISIDYTKNKSFKFSQNTSLSTNWGSKKSLIKFSNGNGWLNFGEEFGLSKKKHTVFLYFDKISKLDTTIDIIDSSEGNYWKGISLEKKTSTQSSTSNPSSSNSKRNSSTGFKSAQQIRNYLVTNISYLDPIEGEYDVQLSYRTDSPFQRDGSLNSTYFIVKDPSDKKLHMYHSKGNEFYELGKPRIEAIGTTNVFRMYWGSSSDRAILENGIRLLSSIELSAQDARAFAGNPRFSHRIILDYDMVKKYPTSDMYTNAGRSSIEATKPQMWTGTGFALADNYIVTNYHVVEDAKGISVQGINGNFKNKFSATIVAADKNNDIAILKVNGFKIPKQNIPYSIKTTIAEVGEDVFVLGYPLTSTMGDEIKLTTGVVSSKTGFQGDISLYQISAPIQPGNSGGPLFDGKGNIIGIVSAKHLGAENVGYAIKASYLRNLIESSISSNILPQTNRVSNLNLSGKVKAVKNYIYYIVCAR